MPPKVSVIIPTYNRAQLLEKALNSVKAQTLPVDEVFVVDMNSQDDTQAVTAKFGPLVHYVNTDLSNPSESRNYGANMATGDYLAFLDSDDQWVESKNQEQVAFMTEDPQLLFSFTDASVVDAKAVEPPVSYIYHYTKSPPDTNDLGKYILDHGNPVPTSSTLVKKDSFIKSGGFNPNLRFHEDADLWIRLSKMGKVGFLDKELTIYITHSGQMTRNPDKEKVWQELKELYK